MTLISRPSKYHLISSGFGTEKAAHSTLTISPSEPNCVLFDKIFGTPKNKRYCYEDKVDILKNMEQGKF